MKKIILIILILLLTSCYDYKEINDLALVSSILVDYQEEYHISFEILDSLDNSYIVSTTGTTIENAFDNINTMISNTPYYNHLKVLTISKSIANNHLQELINYITRNPSIRNEFYIALFDNPNEILNNNQGNITLSSKLSKLIEANDKSNNKKVFEDFLEELLNPYTYAFINQIGIENNDTKIQGLAFFNNYKYIDTLDFDKSNIINLINNKKGTIILNNNSLNIKVDSCNIKFDINKKTFNINIIASGQIISNNKNINIVKPNEIKKIEKTFSKILNTKLNELLIYMQNNNYDLININDIYYKKYKTIKNNIKDYNIIFNTSLVINKKGLTYNE